MKKLIALVQAIDNNLIYFLIVLFLFIIPLYPKLPLFRMEYTYIAIRAEDFFVAFIYIVFLIQVLRKKVKLNLIFFKLFLAYWIAITLSLLFGMYIAKTLPYHQVATLATLRRLEYMGIFFVAASAVNSQKAFKWMLHFFMICLLIVSVYGIGQRFLNFPAVSTMNPEFARGHILFLTPEARISSTFGGHYDLAAYLVLMLPVLWGIYFSPLGNKFFLFTNWLISYIVLMYTASRASLLAYAATPLFLGFMKKFKYLGIVVILSGIIFGFNKDLTKRISQTLQIRQILVNEKTGQVYVPQHITSQNLPAGSYYISLDKSKAQTDKDTQQTIKNATASGKLLTASEEASLLANSRDMQAVSSVVADTSFSTRIQVEWPRAINAFLKNPALGTGPSSITESTDGDYFRIIGEFGLLGLITFALILFTICKYILDYTINYADKAYKPIFYGLLFGFLALLINAVLIDVFEASKVAFTLWLLLGTYVGYISHETHSDKKRPV